MKRKGINSILNISLVLCVTFCMMFLFSSSLHSKKKIVVAADPYTANMLVQLDSNVTIYTTGNKVINLKNTITSNVYTGVTTNYAEYYVMDTQTTSIHLSAVNENKIFTNWHLFDSANPSIDLTNDILGSKQTNNSVEFYMPQMVGKLVVSAKYRNAVDADQGKYFAAPYFIDNADEMEALSRIINQSNATLTDYQIFDEKMTGSNDNYLALQYGYFKVTTSFMLNASYTSIGTVNHPFHGLVDGKNNNEISKISLNQNINITTTGNTGNLRYGLFGYISENKERTHSALLRNLGVQGVISIIESTPTPSGYENAYVGGFGGIAGSGVLIYNCVSNMDISISTIDINVNVGGFFGTMFTNFEYLSGNVINGKYKNWNISTSGTTVGKGNIRAGGLAGYIANAYIYDLNADFTDYNIIVSALQYGDVYVGSVVGQQAELSEEIIANSGLIADGPNKPVGFMNIIISDNDSFYMGISSNYGENYIGTFIGKVTANNMRVNIANCYYKSTNTKTSHINVATADQNSKSNIYFGGVIGFIEGLQCYYGDIFQNENQPFFDGNINFEVRQKGLSNAAATYGKLVVGGVVGKGIMNINGARIFLNSEHSEFKMQAIQDKFSYHDSLDNTNQATTGSNYEHISMGLFTGSFGDTSNISNFAINDFVLIANHAEIRAIREENSKSFGQITVGGLVGYSDNLSVSDSKILLNSCSFYIDSLSYDVKYSNEGNNAYLGGFIGRYGGITNRLTTASATKMMNCTIAGYNFLSNSQTNYEYKEENIIGATANIEGIQNTQPGEADYRGEIYVGGLIGTMKDTQVENCHYKGAFSNTNVISLRGNNNMDSGMTGGLVGLVRSSNGNMFIKNSTVSNVMVTAEATTSNTPRPNPDIYAGGLIGAVFFDNSSTSSYFYNNTVANSIIKSLGHLSMKTYSAGICGGSTWQAAGIFYNNLSYNNRITSISDVQDAPAYASGVICLSQGNDVTTRITGCASVNDYITAYNESTGLAAAAGIVGSGLNNILISDCYVSSILNAYNELGSQFMAKMAYHSGTISYDGSYNYYHSSKLLGIDDFVRNGVGYASANCYSISFSNYDKLPIHTKLEDLLGLSLYYSESVNDINDIANGKWLRPYTYVESTNPSFLVTQSNSDNNSTRWGIENQEAGATSVILWIKVLNTYDSSYVPSSTNLEEAYLNGWVMFGEISLVTEGIETHEIELEFPTEEENNQIQKVDGALENINNYEQFMYYGISSSLEELGVKLQEQLLPLQFNVRVIQKLTHQLQTNVDVHILFKEVDSNGVEKDVDLAEISKLGTLTLNKNDDGTFRVNYVPNLEYLETEIKMLRLYFIAADAQRYLTCIFISNIYEEMKATYSPTTKPLDYLQHLNDETYGQTEENPYIFTTNSTAKIIPDFLRRNERNRVISDSNTSLISYIAEYRSITSGGTWSPTTIYASGELKIDQTITSGRIYRITLTLFSKYNIMNLSSQTCYILVLERGNISTSLKGTDYEGPSAVSIYDTSVENINGINYNSDYIFTIKPKNGFGDIPNLLDFTVGGRTYQFIQQSSDTGIIGLQIINLDTGNCITVEENGKNKINWEVSETGYEVIIPSHYITSGIRIDVEFSIVYSLLFDINLDFDNISSSERFLRIKSTSKSTISSLIGLTKQYDASTGKYYYSLNEKDENGDFTCYLKEIENNAPFGYSLHGWYLIDDSSYALNYGKSIEEILGEYANNNNGAELMLNGNYTFYARWIFSIIVNEAPGTQVKCSFPSYFLVTDDNFVDVPINNKKGFAFTVIKQDGFEGESRVVAHILEEVVENGEVLRILKEVVVEKYYENMYIYSIAPENINGVLIITTYSNDTEFIVGEMTNNVEESIIPEDGVYTLKYVINHQKNEDKYRQTFAYDETISNLRKKLKVSFTSMDTTGTYALPFMLPVGTEIKLYYLIDGVEHSVGYIKLTEEKSEFYSTDFKLVNSEKNQFDKDETFASFLNGISSRSESYYFVITPPNGYTELEKGSMLDCEVSIGYVDETVKENYLVSERYLEGSTIMNSKYYEDIKKVDSEVFLDIANSKDTFFVYKSRETYLEGMEGQYEFYISDTIHEVQIQDRLYKGVGDYRHKDKYFMLGVQLYLGSDSTETPIDLTGLKISIFLDKMLIAEEVVTEFFPKNAVYFEISESGFYHVEVSIVDVDLAKQASTMEENTSYGIVATLLESSTSTKPAFGTIRSKWDSTKQDYIENSGYVNISPETIEIFNLLDTVYVSHIVAYNDLIELPASVEVPSDHLEIPMVWTIGDKVITSPFDIENYGIENDIIFDENKTLTLTANINYNGNEISKDYILIVLPNPYLMLEKIVAEITLPELLEDKNQLSDDGCMEYGTKLKSELLKNEVLLNISYTLHTTGLEVIATENNNQYIVGGLRENPVVLEVEYEYEGSKVIVVYDTYNNYYLEVEEDATLRSKLEEIENYIHSSYKNVTSTENASAIAVFNNSHLEHGIDGVSWSVQSGSSLSGLMLTDGVLTINSRSSNQLSNCSLVYTDSYQRKLMREVSVVVLKQDTTLTTNELVDFSKEKEILISKEFVGYIFEFKIIAKVIENTNDRNQPLWSVTQNGYTTPRQQLRNARMTVELSLYPREAIGNSDIITVLLSYNTITQCNVITNGNRFSIQAYGGNTIASITNVTMEIIF